MRKIIPIILLLFSQQNYANKTNSYKNSNITIAPWEIGENITRGFCSKAAIGWCHRIFLGITTSNKILVQDFYTETASFNPQQNSHDPYMGIITSKMTDPFTLLTIEDANTMLFYIKEGKEGPYTRYDEHGYIIEQGTYTNGKKQGFWMDAIENDKFYGFYHNDKKEGFWISAIQTPHPINFKSFYNDDHLISEEEINSTQLDEYNQLLLQQLAQQGHYYHEFIHFFQQKNIN